MAAAAALPRASCFFEDEPRGYEPYDRACRHFAEEALPLPLPAKSSFPPDQVVLNVYELTAFEQVNRLMATEFFPIGGALHVGVEVYGREWSYNGGDGPGAGVRCEVPRSNCLHRFREALPLAKTPLSDGEVALVIGELVESWQPKDYHWLHRNCLAFANELCQRLQVGRIPAWIDRFARGAGVVDLGMRGLAGGLLESVQGVALGAQELVRSLVEGPQSCTSCVPAPGVAVCTVSCEGQSAPPWERLCAGQGLVGPRHMQVVEGGVEADGPCGCSSEPLACAAPQWRSLFEDVHDPDERIVYAAGGAHGTCQDIDEVRTPDKIEPDAEAPAAAAPGPRPVPVRKGSASAPRGPEGPARRQDRASYTPTPARARCRTRAAA